MNGPNNHIYKINSSLPSLAFLPSSSTKMQFMNSGACDHGGAVNTLKYPKADFPQTPPFLFVGGKEDEEKNPVLAAFSSRTVRSHPGSTCSTCNKKTLSKLRGSEHLGPALARAPMGGGRERSNTRVIPRLLSAPEGLLPVGVPTM